MAYGIRDSFLYGSYKRVRSALRRRGGGGFSSARSMVEYDIRFGGLKLLEERLDVELNSRDGMVGKHMNRIARIITDRAKAQVGADTGRLRSSIKWRYERAAGGQERIIGSDLPYALAHHEGTKPHIIKPKNGQVLSFKSKGASVIVEEVMHPGTPANRYLSDNLVAVTQYLNMLPRV